MAEFRDQRAGFEAAGVGVVAVSVDEPRRSAALRRGMGLPFPILCDTDRSVVETWGLLDRREAGGVARPALFVVERDRRVRCRFVGGTAARVSAADLLRFLRSGTEGPAGPAPRRRAVLPRPRHIIAALMSAARFGRRSPVE